MPIGIQEKHERDSFDEFLDTLKEDREIIQEPVIPEEPSAATAPADNLPGIDDIEKLDPVVERNKLDIAMIPAETIVDVIDTTAISVNSYIAMEHQDGASPSEKESLQKAVANYLRETDIDISPGKMCLVLVVMIYAPKVLQAFQTRKLNIENERLRAHVADLEQQLKDRDNGKIPAV